MIMIFFFAFVNNAWNIFSGYVGLVSFGHGAFLGLGAYVSTLLLLNFGVSPWIGIFAGFLLTSLVAVALSIPLLKLSGHFFALSTIAVREIIKLGFEYTPQFGGAMGLHIPIIHGFSPYYFQFSSKIPYYYIAFIFLLVQILIIYKIEKSKIGYYFIAIRESESTAKSLGINTKLYKTIALSLSAGFSAIAGTVYAQYFLYIDPTSTMGVLMSVEMLLSAVIGGVGTLLGPIIGAIVLVPIETACRVYLGGMFEGFHLIIYGLLLIIVSIFAPGGIYGKISSKMRK
jgi:branched-chain amino acid transport system permease protein